MDGESKWAYNITKGLSEEIMGPVAYFILRNKDTMYEVSCVWLWVVELNEEACSNCEHMKCNQQFWLYHL